MSRPVKFETPEQMQEAIDAYFDKCDRDGEVYTVTGLALALDLTRAGLINYSEKDQFFNTIKRAKQKVEQFNERRLFEGSPAGVIFNLKNNFGWVDKTETVNTNKNTNIDLSGLDDETLKKLEDAAQED